MKLPLFAVIMIALGSYSAIAAEAPCYFQCQEVPDASRMITHIGSATETALPNKEIKMLVWNIYKGSKPAFNQVFTELTNAIKPNVVVLEEATTDYKVDSAFRSLPFFGWNLAANFIMKGGIPTGPVVGSQVQPKSVRFHRTSDREPFVESPKATVITEFAVKGMKDKLLVLGIHGINFANDLAYERQIREIAEIIGHHKGPVVLAGDFNTRNFERTEMTPRILAEVGMTRAPWEAEAPGVYYQLDDAYTRGVKVVAAQIWAEDVEGIGSDHPAMFLKFGIPIAR